VNFTETRGSRSSAGKLVSDCGRYCITWDTTSTGTWFNAWFGDSPCKHLTGTFDKTIAQTVCDQHKRKFQQQRQHAA
jgi:hypothetical protein